MIPKLIESFCNLITSRDEVIIITMISRYFQLWNNINKKFETIFLKLLMFLEDKFFSVSFNLDFVLFYQ